MFGTRPLAVLIALAVTVSAAFVASSARAQDRFEGEGCSPDTPPFVQADWRHGFRSGVVSRMRGAPRHLGFDTIVNPGSYASVKASFTYGNLGDELTDEDIAVFMRKAPCGAWQPLPSMRTDRHGRAELVVPGRLLLETGRYEVRMAARGDLSTAHADIRVIAQGTSVVVFDIDGTLTTSDGEMVRNLLYRHDPQMWPGANAVVRAYDMAGLDIIYLSGRVAPLREKSLRWLKRNGFPPGALFGAADLSTGSGGDEPGVQRFKRETLKKFQEELGLRIWKAYGNAETDICAYAQAGISVLDTFIVGPNAGHDCPGFAPSGVINSYPEHLREYLLPLLSEM